METKDDILASLEDLDKPQEEVAPAEELPAADPFAFGEESAPEPAPAAPSKPKKKAPPKKSPPSAEPKSPGASLSAQVAAQVVAVLGKKTLSIRELTELQKGDVVDFNRFPNEAIDLVANGKLMAKGELVEIEGKLGVRLIKIF